MNSASEKKIILVTSGQPSLNPRLVKEADALCNAGYKVTVFYSYWNDWATEYDKQLLSDSKWEAICVGGSPNANKVSYFISRIIFKFSNAFMHPAFAEIGLSRASLSLIRAIQKHKAELYIAHNLGALPAAVIAAKKHNKRCGFDAEDFHRNETSDDKNDAEVKRKIVVEDKYLPQLNYFTTSSPQIARRYSELYPALKPIVLLNTFNKSKITSVKSAGPLKLFWFSQTVGLDRGIEDVVNALSMLKQKDYELHLLGSSTPFIKDFFDRLASGNANIVFHHPVASDAVITFAAQFDIGLALEKKTPLNRDLCLTNKIFTYLQAGLAVIASQTTAQAEFMGENPEIGFTYPIGDAKALAEIISGYRQNAEVLNAHKKASLKMAHERYNWETESGKFLKLVKETL